MSTDVSAREAAADSPRVARLARLGIRLGILVLCLGAVIFIARNWNRWVGAARVQTTDDAYTAADVTPIGARVAGIVESVPVKDFERVKAGALLVQVRDDDYRAQVESAEADLAAAEAAYGNVLAQRPQRQAEVAAASANVEAMRATLQRDQAESQRQRDLLATGIAGTRQRVEQADAARSSDQANLDRAMAQLHGAGAALVALDSQEKQARAGIDARQAALALARINLGYTKIVAPSDGEVGQRLVRPGQFVAAGTQVIAHVALPNIWVSANFKETQLTNVRRGQQATIRVDAFPGRVLKGHVDSLSPGSGSQFSLLPADNATGNFTKVVQRVPVKIVIDDSGDLRNRLRPGLSVMAAIDTASEPVP
ncbi:MAG: HlyD family secretion protein [Acetobacteraceae bacterium]|nr:HlyD family secretion protein [Acetobacteraceae bacterium]